MTAFVFPGFKGLILTGGLAFPASTVRAALVASAPTPALLWLSQIVPVAISAPLASLNFPAAGMFTSSPASFAAVVSMTPLVGFALFVDKGDPAASPLVAWQDDTNTGNGFPYSPQGGPVTITPDPTSGWFTL